MLPFMFHDLKYTIKSFLDLMVKLEVTEKHPLAKKRYLMAPKNVQIAFGIKVCLREMKTKDKTTATKRN